jgi:alkylated DNA repair protein (DNA oxidative demethylase)
MESGTTSPSSIEIALGVRLWREALSREEQRALAAEIFRLARNAPFYRPTMPKSEKPFSVQETNFGPLGWFSDRNGYRYIAKHPYTDEIWPAIPEPLLALWNVAAAGPPPECCLVNLYRDGARMGLHQDRDEAALEVPVVSLSLGDDALFRIGTTSRKGATHSIKLASGDLVAFGGPARLAFHGIDRVMSGTSVIVPGGGRINLTLRRVTSPKKDARPGG